MSEALLLFFRAAIPLDLGHTCSPIVLVWSHSGLRQIALSRPFDFIVLPVAIMIVCTTIGLTTHDYHALGPFVIMGWIYWGWNIYHFGMQNFGIARLLRVPVSRESCMAFCLAFTAVGMVVWPKLSQQEWVTALVLISLTHWLTDIGLSSYAIGRRWWLWACLFVAGMLLLGAAGFLYEHATSQGRMIPKAIFAAVMGPRLGLGFVHFLYSAWIWPQALGLGPSREKPRFTDEMAA